MILPLARVLDYGDHAPIPSKELGVGPAPAWATQKYWLEQIAAGLERDVHEFWTLKGRQEGITTESLILGTWWLQKYSGMQGMLVAEKDTNRKYLRDVVRQMVTGLPRDYQCAKGLRPGADNDLQLAWGNGSRLMFEHAEVRGTLGRSRGINVLLATEMGSWNDQGGIKALRMALARKHPRRLYSWEGTARGFGAFHDLWSEADKAITQRAIFVGPWLHPDYRIERSHPTLWRAYGESPPTSEEALWMHAVKQRFGVEVTREFLAFYRYSLIEEMAGDEAMLHQELPVLPEEAFQAFGNKFVAEAVLRRLRVDVDQAPEPKGYQYEWGRTFDERGEETVRECDPGQAPLRVWEEPDPQGVYMVAAHPWGSSSPEAAEYVIEVFRLYPDQMIQVAEYASDTGAMYQFAWACVHLCGVYSQAVPPYFVLEILGPGRAVLQELQNMERYGWGLSTKLRQRGNVLDFLGSVRHYLYRRPDTFSANAILHWQSSPNLRPWMLTQWRDTLERGGMVLRSAETVAVVASLRQGGPDEDNDQIQGSGTLTDARALACALANKHWIDYALPDLVDLLAPKEPERDAPENGAEMVVQGFFERLSQGRE